MKVSAAKRERLFKLRNSAPVPYQPARWAGYVQLGGMDFPLMSLLSDDLIKAELDAVTKNQREQVSANLWMPDVQVGAYTRDPETGKRRFIYSNKPLGTDFPFSGLDQPKGLIDPLLEQEVIWSERRRTYATGRTIDPSEDNYCGPFISDASDNRTSIGKTHTVYPDESLEQAA